MAVFWPFCPPFECRFSQKFINDEAVLKSVDCGTPGRLEVSQIRLIFAPMQITTKKIFTKQDNGVEFFLRK